MGPRKRAPPPPLFPPVFSCPLSLFLPSVSVSPCAVPRRTSPNQPPPPTTMTRGTSSGPNKRTRGWCRTLNVLDECLAVLPFIGTVYLHAGRGVDVVAGAAHQTATTAAHARTNIVLSGSSVQQQGNLARTPPHAGARFGGHTHEPMGAGWVAGYGHRPCSACSEGAPFPFEELPNVFKPDVVASKVRPHRLVCLRCLDFLQNRHAAAGRGSTSVPKVRLARDGLCACVLCAM